ncbi:MAG: hypothetical protein VYD87_21205 [Pseudomonadota bacterium]|nr:hypothetical protein [Pseudomonadota bacterium]
MDLILFMGHHKVGSSALQLFLARNWLALARAGVLYPAVEAQGMAANLSAALAGASSGAGVKAGAGLAGGGKPRALRLNEREPHNALAFRMMHDDSGRAVPPWHPKLPHSSQMIRIIRAQIEALKPRAVVLCSEVFANFGPDHPAALARLAAALPGAKRVRILCTLRRPDTYLVSWHGQRLKFGHKVPALRGDALDIYWKGIHFDYRRMLEPWFDAFPGAEFDIRDYADVLAAGGSVADFAARSGLALPEGLEEVRSANPSVHPALMEVARRANAELEAEPSRLLRQHLIKAGEKLAVHGAREVEMFGPANRDLMAARFAPIDAWLGERVGRAGFFPDLDAVARPAPVAELDAAREALAALRRPRELRALPGPARDFVTGLELA